METFQPRMRLRSAVTPEEREANNKKIPKVSKDTLPYIEFIGKIVYETDLIGCAMACDELLKVAKQSEEILVIGFDMEWPFSFKTGPGKTALIQISPNLDITYLLHVSEMKNLPAGLCELLAHPKIRLTGNNIKNDIRKLARDFKVTDVEKIIENCIDCGVFANDVLSFSRRWSLAALVEYLLNMRISKDKKVRMSKWGVIPLSKEQMIYAATDTYASLKVYLEIKKLKNDPSLIEKLPQIV
ncbi:Werner Syndrome-like exonuclease [Coccinella septempunctata]|uniref:Werner Syndrome-like exonuclease n=1 Tax=Coccinella septempunctata TaxID=41139 RepID=UPI001D07298D|nr:Werner Syndrome-like exonuclease [Coccinella septempunctata]